MPFLEKNAVFPHDEKGQNPYFENVYISNNLFQGIRAKIFNRSLRNFSIKYLFSLFLSAKIFTSGGNRRLLNKYSFLKFRNKYYISINCRAGSTIRGFFRSFWRKGKIT